jgi:hypothetical protein
MVVFLRSIFAFVRRCVSLLTMWVGKILRSTLGAWLVGSIKLKEAAVFGFITNPRGGTETVRAFCCVLESSHRRQHPHCLGHRIRSRCSRWTQGSFCPEAKGPGNRSYGFDDPSIHPFPGCHQKDHEDSANQRNDFEV